MNVMITATGDEDNGRLFCLLALPLISSDRSFSLQSGGVFMNN